MIKKIKISIHEGEVFLFLIKGQLNSYLKSLFLLSELFLMDVEKLFFIYFISSHFRKRWMKKSELMHITIILYINLCCVHWMTCIVKNFHQIYMQRVETKKILNSIKFAVELVFLSIYCIKKQATWSCIFYSQLVWFFSLYYSALK